MAELSEVAYEPLGRLLGGVCREVFSRRPQTLKLRDLQRDMSAQLGKLRVNKEYRVLTNRGAPSFLLIPIDPEAWTSLLAVAPPETEQELELAWKQQLEGKELPDTDAVLRDVNEVAIAH